uniref:ATP synthase F0 subunit 6 n=1 Tax=Turritopsis lata TaxID=1246326 RepID=UPI001C0EA357|nr:ATP synthase F0 subunit 6 [Turritopsis lata]QQW46719.1 ATP synthase F0 subunit 6 [Turritopsis lata]
MATYFDHFILTKVITYYISDSFFIFFFVIIVYGVIFKSSYLIPSRIQSVIELIIDHWVVVVRDNLGEKMEYYVLPLIGLFLFLLGVNLMGFFLYTFPSTTHLFLTFGLAFSIWLGVILFGFRKFKTSFLSMFMPSGSPLLLSPFLVAIEMVSNLSRPVALGMRLAANLTAGHILLAILADFGCKLLFYSYSFVNLFPIFIIVFMTVLEVGVLVIQAYVFTLLSMIYLKDSLILH